MYISEAEMQEVVREQSLMGERQGQIKVSLNIFVGEKISGDDVSETIDMSYDRVGQALEEIRHSLRKPGDHALVIGHDHTMRTLIHRYVSDLFAMCTFIPFSQKRSLLPLLIALSLR